MEWYAGGVRAVFTHPCPQDFEKWWDRSFRSMENFEIILVFIVFESFAFTIVLVSIEDPRCQERRHV